MVYPAGVGSVASSPSRESPSNHGNVSSKEGSGVSSRTPSLTLDEIRRGLQRSKEANASRNGTTTHARSNTTPLNAVGSGSAPMWGENVKSMMHYELKNTSDQHSATIYIPEPNVTTGGSMSGHASVPTSSSPTSAGNVATSSPGRYDTLPGSKSEAVKSIDVMGHSGLPQDTGEGTGTRTRPKGGDSGLGGGPFPPVVDGSLPRSMSIPNYPVVPGGPATSTPLGGTDYSAGGQGAAGVSNSSEVANLKAASSKLAQLCQEALVYVDILDSCRSRLQAENTRLRGQIQQFEGLLDESRERERVHLETAQSHRDGLSKFEAKYKHIKEKAKSSIHECQSERDRYRKEWEELRQKVETLETELNNVQPQLVEIERLREATHSIHEMREKMEKQDGEMVDLHLKVRRLENDNGQLATDRTRLQHQLDEMQGMFKSGSRRSVMGAEDLFGAMPHDGSPKGTSTTANEDGQVLAEKLMLIVDLEDQLADRENRCGKAEADALHYQKEAAQLQQYVEALLLRVEQQEQIA